MDSRGPSERDRLVVSNSPVWLAGEGGYRAGNPDVTTPLNARDTLISAKK